MTAAVRKTRPVRRRRFQLRSMTRWVVFGVVGVYLLLPLVAMLEFSTRDVGWSRSFAAWRDIGVNRELLGAVTLSLELAALTVIGMLVLLTPTMVWVHLRVPRLRRVIEFICLLPLSIPAIVLVVGLAPVYSWVNYIFGDSPLLLAYVYVILVLPYAYRAIHASLLAVDIETLSEAARGLGASWPQVFIRIVVPAIRGGLLSASVLAIALVLGEFTISSLLNYDTLQVIVNLLGLRNAGVSVAVSLAALIFGFVLLFVVSTVGSRRRRVVRAAAQAEGVNGSDS
ncbi:MAG: Spermidine/putrescine transport system permease protein PotB [Actinobacteria bacterium ADurb.BinA094]|nr:MAG: Spermidine/putrescine transport system permease protein PotB [Actinobacteria bacterium ADurb.BinA094]